MIRIAILSLFLFHAYRLYPVAPAFDCHPSAQLIRGAMYDGMGAIATAITGEAEVLQFYLNKKTGAWAVIGVDRDLNGCTLQRGTDWQFTLE